MGLFNKIKWILGFLLVFVLIIATNLIDRNNFIQVRDAVVTIYEDRLIASDLILDISYAVQDKQMAVALTDTSFFQETNAKVRRKIKGYIARYEQTKLTPEEDALFAELKENLNGIVPLEQAYIASGYQDKAPLKAQLGLVQDNLNGLSKIQLHEGSRQMTISQRAIDTMELFTQIEIFMLVFLAIVIQIIVIYKPKE